MINFFYEIKKSKFYSYIFCVNNLNQVTKGLEAIKKEHKKFTHICYAYKINNENGFFVKCNDDGEPSGTAGKPILNVLDKNNINNVICVVVRYFGGVKLGAGGLCRAYSKSASEVCKLFLENK